jgi:predicted dehydrogenase
LHHVVIVGCGFVADLYMRSFKRHPEIVVSGAFDREPQRLARFCEFWSTPAAASLDSLLETARGMNALVLNLTNPRSHFEVSRAALQKNLDVYSEKPLAMTLAEAAALTRLAEEQGLLLASAPCSFLSEAAQTMMAGLRDGAVGQVKLVYAELDDGYLASAPYEKWVSESGAPWPARDEFEVGCTIEHAGYALTWLMAAFGPIRTIAAASAGLVPEKLEGASAPDFSVGVLFFETGVVARLTASILAPHDHAIKVIGSSGVLSVDDCWKNDAAVTVRKRLALRRRLLENPIAQRLKVSGPTHPKTGRRGAASMNFALGPAEIFSARTEKRQSRMRADFALHLTEATLALQNAGESAGAYRMTTRFVPPELLPWAKR